MTAKGQAMLGWPLPELNLPGLPLCLAQVLLLILLPTETGAEAFTSHSVGEEKHSSALQEKES